MAKSFVSSVLTVAGGSAVAQAIAIVALPFITRLYPPDIYGVFVIFLAYGGIVSPVVCARFDVAIALPRRAGSASAVALGSLAVALVIAALTAAMLLALAATVPGFGGAGAGYIPLYVLLCGALQVFGNWSARTRDYARLSLSRIAQALVTSLLAIGAAHFYGASATQLILSTVLAQAVALAVLLGGLPGSGFAVGVRPHQVRRLLRHFRRLAAFNVPHVLSDTAQASGLPLLVAALFGAPVAAYYSFSIRLMKAPLGLISSAISQVYYPRAAAHRNDNVRLRRDALRILTALSLAALALLPVVLLMPDAAYTFVFGPAWHEVGTYLRALSPWTLSSFVAAPLSVLYLVKEEFALDFYLGLAGSVLAFTILFAVRLVSDDVLIAMWALSLGMTLYVVVSTIAEFRIVIGRGSRRV